MLAQDCEAGVAETPRCAGELARAQHVHLRWEQHWCLCPGCEFLELAFAHPKADSPAALHPPSPTASPSLRCWAESWPRGSFRGTRPHAPPVSPLASPCLTQALPHRHLGTERCLWVLCPLQATVVMWKILQVPCVPHTVMMFFPRLFVHLLLQVLISTLDTPEEIDKFWKGCQEDHGFAASPNRFSIPVLLSLPCPQGRSQCSQHDLSFVLHTGLQWRP